MDSITKAVEKAREMRQAVAKPQQAPAAPTQVVYTQTRTVRLSQDELREKRIITEYEQGDFADAYKILRTRVLHVMRANGWNALGVTSCGPNEGKTLTAINLSIGLAMEENQTVLLVDMDLRRPSVHTAFGIRQSKGLSDCLVEDIPLQSVLVHPGISRLVVLPSTRPLYKSSEMVSSPRMVKLVQEIKTRYPSRLVVFDMPPILASDDVIAFSPYIDAVLLVVEAGKTQIEELGRATELLKKVNLIGSVLNKSTEAVPGAYYY